MSAGGFSSSRFVNNNNNNNSRSNTTFKPGTGSQPSIIFGTGYIIHPREKLYDASGKRITTLSQETYDAYIAAGRCLSDPALRRAFYNEPAILCSEDEIRSFKLRGMKAAYRHDESRIIGKILSAAIELPQVLLTVEVTDKEISQSIQAEGIDAARAFSIGMIVRLDGREVISKECREFSVVPEPFYGGCNMEVVARVVAGSETGKEGEEIFQVYLTAGDFETGVEGEQPMSGEQGGLPQTTAAAPSAETASAATASQNDVSMETPVAQPGTEGGNDETMDDPSAANLDPVAQLAKLQNENRRLREKAALNARNSDLFAKQQDQKATELLTEITEGTTDKKALFDNREGYNNFAQRLHDMATSDPDAFSTFAMMIRGRGSGATGGLPASPPQTAATTTTNPITQSAPPQQPQGGLPRPTTTTTTTTTTVPKTAPATAPRPQTAPAKDVRNGPVLDGTGKIATPAAASRKRDYLSQMYGSEPPSSSSGSTTTTTPPSAEVPQQGSNEYESPSKKQAYSGGGSTSDFLKGYGFDVPVTAGVYLPEPQEGGVVFLSQAVTSICRGMTSDIEKAVSTAAFYRNNKSAFVNSNENRFGGPSSVQGGAQEVKVLCSHYGGDPIPLTHLPRGAFPYIEDRSQGPTRHRGENEFYNKTRANAEELAYGFRLKKQRISEINWGNPAERFLDRDHLEQAMRVQVGSCLDWNKSYTVCCNSDVALLAHQHDLIEKGRAGFISQTDKVAVTASDTPFVLSGTNAPNFFEEGSESMEKMVERARGVPYFAGKTNAELMTCALLFKEGNTKWTQIGDPLCY